MSWAALSSALLARDFPPKRIHGGLSPQVTERDQEGVGCLQRLEEILVGAAPEVEEAVRLALVLHQLAPVACLLHLAAEVFASGHEPVRGPKEDDSRRSSLPDVM